MPVVAAALTAWLWRTPSSAEVADAERPLLAVRPFRSLSPDGQQKYFADGMTEEIRGQLSQISALRLLSRDGLDAYDARSAVRELGLREPDRARNLAAIEQLRTALALDPQFALARGHLAYRLMFMAAYDGATYLDQAIAEAEATVRMDPSLSYGYFALGTAYGNKGLGAKSRQAFHRALELDPNDTGAMNNFKNEEIRRGRLDEAAY